MKHFPTKHDAWIGQHLFIKHTNNSLQALKIARNWLLSLTILSSVWEQPCSALTLLTFSIPLAEVCTIKLK